MIHVRIMILLATGLAAWVSRRSPSWRSVAIVLGVPLCLDVLCELVRLPARLDLALWLGTPVLSTWGAWRVLARARGAAVHAWWAWCALAFAVLVTPEPRAWWKATPMLVRLASVALQAEAARAWWRSRRVATGADAATVLLLAGDLVSLIGPAGVVPGPWWIAGAQAGIVAVGVMALALVHESRWAASSPMGRGTCRADPLLRRLRALLPPWPRAPRARAPRERP